MTQLEEVFTTEPDPLIVRAESTDSTERGLLQAIIDTPHDMTPRLIYCDWLEENEFNLRAEFIRVQMGLYPMRQDFIERYKPCEEQNISVVDEIRGIRQKNLCFHRQPLVCKQCRLLVQREAELFNTTQARGYLNICKESLIHTDQQVVNKLARLRFDGSTSIRFGWRRGFVEKVYWSGYWYDLYHCLSILTSPNPITDAVINFAGSITSEQHSAEDNWAAIKSKCRHITFHQSVPLGF